MAWNLYNKEKFLEPLCFSNGKSQEDVVQEVLEKIEEGKKIIFIHGVCGTGKCLNKDSLIFCKPRGELTFSYYKISEIVGKEGLIVSLDGKGNLRESNFKNVRKTGLKDIYKLKTRTGREILASKNHPFLTITKHGTEWKPLEKLNKDSYICLPNKIDLESTLKLPDEEIKIIAHLIAEGKLGGKNGAPKYYQCKNQNPLIRKDYIDALKKRFPDGKIKETGDCEVKINFYNMDTTSGTTNRLRLLVRKYGLDGKKSNNKFIPKEIFGLNKKGLSIFLSRLFSGDGSIYERTSSQIVIEYDSISKRLVQDISILLNHFGIQHTISSKKFKENLEYSYRISISESSNIIKFVQEIGFVGRKQTLAENLIKKLEKNKFSNTDKVPRVIREYMKSLGYSYLELDRFLNYDKISQEKEKKSFKEIRKDKSINTPCVFKQGEIDFLRTHIIEANKQIKDDILSFISNKDIFWDKIRSIEFEKEDEVYDLEVEGTHNFIANGIVVHNSAIALNIASKLGKTSVIVPGKNLQNQYKRDYEGDKYLKKSDGTKLKISVITGRKNHKCKFLEENKTAIPPSSPDGNLNDIFQKQRDSFDDLAAGDMTCDNIYLPCKIEIKEKNWYRLKEYLKQNNKVDLKEINEIKDVKRMGVAAVCPYWSPVFPDKYDLKEFGKKKRTYEGLGKTSYIQYKREKGCPFYAQFDFYMDSDVVVFNSLKYKLETALNRKPMTEVEVVDECDEFLDSLSNQRNINIEKLQNALIQAMGSGEGDEDIIDELFELISYFKKDPRLNKISDNKDIIPLKATGIFDILKLFLKEEWLQTVDGESYLMDVLETAKMFKGFMQESFVTITKTDKQTNVGIVTTNLAKKLEEFIIKNKVMVLMSGTLHSDDVLRNIFGITDFVKIDAETKDQGTIEVKRLGVEIDCKYSNFSAGKFTRKDYLEALEECITQAPRPTLVHVNAFQDLPSEEEISQYSLRELISRDKIREMQMADSEGRLIKEFKEGKREILFSTRDSRGVDFPGNECKSIVFTKYPNPNVQDAFWKILMKTKPHAYWSFYKDKARRELLQKIYRGLRFKEDHIYLLSPDSRVLDIVEKDKESFNQ
ncbi:MAG: hypothetical protein PF542_06045 [Nanoarchaeota archaeon]|jgi:intein/homing endonuclease|nr:hypothetical protein [Nanoarchaeota archaeon]